MTAAAGLFQLWWNLDSPVDMSFTCLNMISSSRNVTRLPVSRWLGVSPICNSNQPRQQNRGLMCTSNIQFNSFYGEDNKSKGYYPCNSILLYYSCKHLHLISQNDKWMKNGTLIVIRFSIWIHKILWINQLGFIWHGPPLPNMQKKERTSKTAVKKLL